MNVCRWCGGNTKGTTFCSPECSGAAAEIPELVGQNAPETQLAPFTPRKLASPGRSWLLGVLAGGLLGVGTTLAVSTAGPAPAHNTRCELARAKHQVKSATLDFIQNGLAGIWDGRVDEASDLSAWFMPGEATAAPMARIFMDQSKRQGARLLDAEIVDVRLSPTLDHADAEFFLQVDETRGRHCYTGNFQWASQEDGTWLRTKVSILRATSCK
jgi:hypothetical protein